MASEIMRGPQDEPLPPGTTVLRACKLPPDYPDRPPSREAFNFQLSNKDKEHPVPKLSVFVHELTTEGQACALVGEGTTHRLIAHLKVDVIRKIDVQGNQLDAVWDEALLDDGILDTRPGAEGHAGILGLHRPPGMDRAIFKTLQQRLADSVGENYRVVPIPESPTDVT